jgi:hypothetical protein
MPQPTAREIEAGRRDILARFLAAFEAPEAAAPDKPRMEPECLRTGWGVCTFCGQGDKPLFRYEIDPKHVEWMTCLCLPESDHMCNDCKFGVPGFAPDVACWSGPCAWSRRLESGRMPWLCPSCWRDEVASEHRHVAELEGAGG